MFTKIEGILFGHYDSRGGATLKVGFKGLEAFKSYVEDFRYEPEDDMTGLEEVAIDDFLGRAKVWVGDYADGESDVLQGEIRRTTYQLHFTFDGGSEPSQDYVAIKLDDDGDIPEKYNINLLPREVVEELCGRLGSSRYELRHHDLGEDAFGLVISAKADA